PTNDSQAQSVSMLLACGLLLSSPTLASDLCISVVVLLWEQHNPRLVHRCGGRDSMYVTYQKLRQICNSNYQTPSWPIDAPTDQCDDPLSTCCCNSIAWSVRMLCINCQWDEFGTSDPGHSASAGAYYDYRWSSGTPNQGSYCGDGWNQTLPESVQLAVCQNGVRLEDFLYSIFWADGSWYSPDFEQSAQAILASQTKPLNPCQNTTPGATSTSV
ncbi:hypothetical protein FOMPIDRAFT_123291, partial [Fomitopsis schrenkii]